MGDTLDSLSTVNNFKIYEDYIKEFILKNQLLQKIIFYPYSDPFDDTRAVDLENPYDIFNHDSAISQDGTGTHGVVLFEDKDDTILNSSIPVLLITFDSVRLSDSYFLDTIRIIIQIICKGSSVRKLANGRDRTQVIGDIFDNEFGTANINKIGEIHKQSYTKLSINEENSGYTIIFKCVGASRNLNNNKNYLQKRYGSPDGR